MSASVVAHCASLVRIGPNVECNGSSYRELRVLCDDGSFFFLTLVGNRPIALSIEGEARGASKELTHE